MGWDRAGRPAQHGHLLRQGRVPGAGVRLQRGYLEITMTVLLVAVAVYTILGGMLGTGDRLPAIRRDERGAVGRHAVDPYNVPWQTMVESVERANMAGDSTRRSIRNSAGRGSCFKGCKTRQPCSPGNHDCPRAVTKDTKTGQQIYTRTAFFFVKRS